MNAHVAHNNFHVESQCDIPDVDCSRAETAALLISHDRGRHSHRLRMQLLMYLLTLNQLIMLSSI